MQCSTREGCRQQNQEEAAGITGRDHGAGSTMQTFLPLRYMDAIASSRPLTIEDNQLQCSPLELCAIRPFLILYVTFSFSYVLEMFVV